MIHRSMVGQPAPQEQQTPVDVAGAGLVFVRCLGNPERVGVTGGRFPSGTSVRDRWSYEALRILWLRN